MTLTLGSGPFAQPNQASDRFNFPIDSPDHVLFFDDALKRVRAVFNGKTIADSENAKLLHETGHLPRYYLPQADVRMDLLHATDHHTHCPYKGDAAYWSVKVGDKTAENAAWGYPQPVDGAPPLADYIAFYFDAMDAWFEEDEEIIGHPRDPYHRVDVRPSTRHVIVRVGGEPVAETYRPLLLFETGLPIRYYIPREDVRNERLVASTRRSICPYKGHARYWSVRANGGVVDDLAWSYAEPFAEALKVAGYICFAQEEADVEMDVSSIN